MSQMVACPDCGTPNRADAELCVQCWRGMDENLAARIPTPAFASASAAPPPPAPARPRPQPVRVAVEPVQAREADPGAVPYFAAVGASVAPVPSFPAAPLADATTATKTSLPWGALLSLGLVVALLAGGYFFFFGGKDGSFSPSDGSYSVAMPAGEWEPTEMPSGINPDVLDLMLQAPDERSFIMAMHMPLPGPVTPEMLKSAVDQAQQFMPKVPGLTLSPIQESDVVTGEGVTAYEMTASGGNATDGVGKVRMVFVGDDSASTFVMMMLACGEPQCASAEPAFDEMAKTLELAG